MRRLAALVGVIALATGCGYQSGYTPPDGWRARPVYNGNDVVWVGAQQVPRCAAEVDEESVQGWAAPPPMVLDDRGRWARGGVHVHVWHVGPHPRLHPVYPAYGFIPNPPGPHRLLFPGLGAARGGRGSWSSSGGSSSGGGKGAGMVAALALAIVVVASSGIAVGLAADPPEDGDVAGSIDSINRFNDEARRKIAACYEAARAAAPTPGAAAVEVEVDVVEEAGAW